MLRRTYLGLDLVAPTLHAAALQRHGRGVRLISGRALSLPEGVLKFSAKSPNIQDRPRFVRVVQELLNPLAGSEDRLALALPDQVGRLLLTEAETTFRTRAEGVEILKWQLRNSLPSEGKDVHLDYQVVDTSEGGRQRLLVAVMALAVLRDYEEALLEAGFSAAQVGFHSLALYQSARPRLDMEENGVFVGVEDGRMTLMILANRIPVFHRVRETEPSAERIFHEVSRTLAGLRGAGVVSRRGPVYLHTDWQTTAELVAALEGVFERDVHLLETRPELAPVPGNRQSLSAALGAAEWML